MIIIYDYFAPAYKAGGPTQSLANMASALADDAIDLKVICTDVDLDGKRLEVVTDQWIQMSLTDGDISIQAPDKQGESSLTLLTRKTPRKDFVWVWYASEKGGRDIEKLLGADDVLFINSLFSHHFNYPALFKSKAQRKIVSPRGMLDPGSLSQKAWKKKLYLQYLKLRGFHKDVEWHATTEQEKQNIQKIFGRRSKVWVVPNFPKLIAPQPAIKKRGELKLISIAVISPMKNHLLVLKALQEVKTKVSYEIFGPIKDEQYWAACMEMIRLLPNNITVRYHGDVKPIAIPVALAQGDVAILPSKSENFGHSIFEALTAAKPVITSFNTPWNDLEENRAGMNVSLSLSTKKESESPRSIAEAIEFFAAMGPEEFEVWGKSAREFAIRCLDLGAIRRGYLEMFAR